MPVTHNTGELIVRIQAQTAALAPGSPVLKEAFTRIGLYVSAVAKINVRRRGLIDTGRLINSVRHEFFKDGDVEGIKVGSFNVPYAAVHEFGYRGYVNVKAHSRLGRPVVGHTRQVNIPPRPYLRPAISTSRTFIIDTLRAALQFAKR